MLLQEKDNRGCLGAALDIHMAMLFIYNGLALRQNFLVTDNLTMLNQVCLFRA